MSPIDEAIDAVNAALEGCKSPIECTVCADLRDALDLLDRARETLADLEADGHAYEHAAE